MQTDAAPWYEEFDLGDSSVVELRCSKVGVYVIVEAYRVTAPQPSRIEVFFPEHRGFVLLDFRFGVIAKYLFEGVVRLRWRRGGLVLRRGLRRGRFS